MQYQLNCDFKTKTSKKMSKLMHVLQRICNYREAKQIIRSKSLIYFVKLIKSRWIVWISVVDMSFLQWSTLGFLTCRGFKSLKKKILVFTGHCCFWSTLLSLCCSWEMLLCADDKKEIHIPIHILYRFRNKTFLRK